MVDLSDLDDGIGRRKLPKSAADQIADATKPLFEESSLAKALRDSQSLFDRLGLKGIVEGLSGNAAFDKSLRDLASAQDRLKDAFAPSPIEKAAKTASESVLDRTMTELERVMNPRSLLDDLPSIEMPEYLPNPIHETNEHLEQMREQVRALLDVQAKQTELTNLVLKALVEGGKAQTRLTILGLVIGFIGVVAAIIAIA
jgi:hypothetical protein